MARVTWELNYANFVLIKANPESRLWLVIVGLDGADTLRAPWKEGYRVSSFAHPRSWPSAPRAQPCRKALEDGSLALSSGLGMLWPWSMGSSSLPEDFLGR